MFGDLDLDNKQFSQCSVFKNHATLDNEKNT